MTRAHRPATTLPWPAANVFEVFANLERYVGRHNVYRHRPHGLTGAVVPLAPADGTGHWELIGIRNQVFVAIADFTSHYAVQHHGAGDDWTQFHIKLAGTLVTAPAAEPILIKGPTLLVWQQPRSITVTESKPAGIHERSVTLWCRPEYLRSLFLRAGALGGNAITPYLARDPRHLNYCVLPISANLLACAQRLAANEFCGPMRLLHADAKAMELLCLIVGGFEALSSAAHARVSERDLQRLHDVHAQLASQFNPPPAVAHLARQAGLSETKLRRAFKLVHGKTLHEFSHECRMQHALTLLRDKRLPVGVVTDAVGYGHATTFANAFKKRFGMPPKGARRLAPKS